MEEVWREERRPGQREQGEGLGHLCSLPRSSPWIQAGGVGKGCPHVLLGPSVTFPSGRLGQQVTGFWQRNGSIRVGGCAVRDRSTIVQMRACGLGFTFHDSIFYRLIKWENGSPLTIPGHLVPSQCCLTLFPGRLMIQAQCHR